MAKKESLHKDRIEANRTWKEDTFSISALTKYVQSGVNPHLQTIFNKTGLSKDMVTVDWVLKVSKPEQLLTKSGEKRTKFSLWFISGLILNYAAEISAKAQISSSVKIEEKKPENKPDEKKNTNKAKKAA